MIPRYSRDKMSSIWTDDNKYKIWLEIESHATTALSKLGLVPEEDAKQIWEKGNFNADKINEIEKVTKHDVIAFLTNLAEHIGESSRYVHQGMTSSDVLDTAFSYQLNQASNILLEDIDSLLASLKKRALETKYIPCIGRSHGIHAEPITFGFKFATFYAEFKRAKTRLEQAKKEISVCAISGAVGTFANIDPFVQKYVAEKMGLAEETISTQIIPRDRHAMFFSALAVTASSLERLATEIRHLQRTEVGEAEEFFNKGQKGSSAMPHKRNPVLSENIVGITRMIRSYSIPALENVATWHERDISHSSVERVVAPDATILLDFALARMTNVIENLVIYPGNAEENLNQSKGLIYSQRVLLALTEKGMSRESSYSIVQKSAMESWQNNQDFLTIISSNEEIKQYLSLDELKNLFDISYHTKHIDYIFKQVFES